MKKKFKLTTAILFLVFNRPETTKLVFEKIKRAKPRKLYIAADGPRNEKEKKKTDAVREYLLKNINWECKVKKLFREENLGCKYAVSESIDWFFKNEELGIVLEDDCLPSQSFFRFCQELLEKYKNNKKIMHISGTNLISKKIKSFGYSYFFSKNAFIWGWATWRRAWKDYNIEIYRRLNNKKLRQISTGLFEFLQNKNKIKNLKENKINTWDYQWDWTIKMHKGINIFPKKNLIENIGFSDEFSTHTKENYWDKKFLHYKAEEINFPLKHPSKIKINKSFDKKINYFNLKRLILKKMLRKNNKL